MHFYTQTWQNVTSFQIIFKKVVSKRQLNETAEDIKTRSCRDTVTHQFVFTFGLYKQMIVTCKYHKLVFATRLSFCNNPKYSVKIPFFFIKAVLI